MRCPSKNHDKKLLMEAACRAEKLVSGCQSVDMSKVFGPLFHDPSLVSGDARTLLIFQNTPHQEERILT